MYFRLLAILSQNKECPFRLEALVFSINTSVERIMNMQAYCSEIYDDCGMKVAGGSSDADLNRRKFCDNFSNFRINDISLRRDRRL